MKEDTPATNHQNIDPAIIDLAKLLARFAVDDYLEEIHHPASRIRKFRQAQKEVTESRGDE